MTPTITRGLRQRDIDTTQLTYWANKELIPLVAQLVQAANYVSRVKAKIKTDGTATPFTIWASDDLGVGEVVTITADVIGVDHAERGAYVMAGLFFNNGTVGQEGITHVIWGENGPAYTFAFAVVANHVELHVSDSGDPTSFTAVIDVQSAT